MRRQYLILAIAAVGAVWQYSQIPGQVQLGAGVTAPQAPEQLPLDQAQSFKMNNFEVTPLASYRLTAKLLGREHYRWDGQAEVAPVDLAVAWGPLSDESALALIDFDHRSRWLFWNPGESPLSNEVIGLHTANVHIIPADDSILKTIKQSRIGDVVAFSGALVRVDGAGGWSWKSSLSRNDTGNGACELMWVDHFEILTAHID